MDRKIEKKNWPPKKIAWVSMATIFIGFVFYMIVFGDRSSKLNVNSDRITISTVYEGPFQEFIPISGSVLPIKTVFLDAIEGGRVEKIFLESGNLVNVGDTILKLSNTNLLLDIMYREANLFEQNNNLRNTRLAMEQNSLSLRSQLLELEFSIVKEKREFERNIKLIKKDLISQEDFDQSQDSYNYLLDKKALTIEKQKQDSIFRTVQISQLEASVDRIQNNLGIVKQNLENLYIKAPISGRLTSLNAEIGELKMLGERIGKIDVLNGFKVRADIDEHYIARVDNGQAGTFELAGEKYQLEVRKVDPEVRDGRFRVDMNFVGETPTDIRRGQTLRIRLELGDPGEAILLTRGGFDQKTGGRWVYVLDQSEGFAVKRNIKAGRQNPLVLEILDGLEPGEK
ncbi:MAG: HlyD family efflux transporter periplasmic adaptor subunit, partial [candidate division Zixibacteria bacterium]|nr:HlyD family efflux transporter periplasmic adaptor subunit [candidate division Zixibacteria bacterium]